MHSMHVGRRAVEGIVVNMPRTSDVPAMWACFRQVFRQCEWERKIGPWGHELGGYDI